MFLRPDRTDFQVIAFYLGKVMFGLGLMMLLPAIIAMLVGEWNALTALVIGGSIGVIGGRLSEIKFRTRRPLSWSHGMVTVALSWLLGPVLLAVPFFLSGHFSDFLDAYFDAMSGLTTSGLSVLQDLDHLPRSMNLFRHLTHFAGGQGIVIVVLTLFAGGGAQVGTLYVGEGRDERIMPNIVRTARFIYTVALVYLLAGTFSLWLAGVVAGLQPGSSLFHAVNLFMAGFDTGGFAPQSTSIAYYHSATVELVLVVLMFAGTLSFALHYQLWRGDRRELFRNIETRTLTLTLTAMTLLAFVGLGRSGTFTDAVPLFRKGFFTVVSAHTGTGFGVNAPALFVTDWGILAPAAVVGAMALGGMASSTAGGIKAIRVGLAWKGLIKDVRRVLLPESALVVSTYHSTRRRILDDATAKAAMTLLLLYVLTYLGGAMVGMFYGTWDITETMFESVSATANVGLSVGITDASMPMVLQLTYITQMWLGRLEFMAVFALIGYVVAIVRGRT
ncbi:MAG TPA: potassium transporter TrkG [Nitriliruptorales bacterium]